MIPGMSDPVEYASIPNKTLAKKISGRIGPDHALSR